MERERPQRSSSEKIHMCVSFVLIGKGTWGGVGKWDLCNVLGCITSANCSPTANNRNSFHVASLLSFGTLNVHAPPLTFRLSSHTGFTPRLKKCTLSFIFSASSGNQL